MIFEREGQRVLEVGQKDLEGDAILGLGGVYDYIIVHCLTRDFYLNTEQYAAFKPMMDKHSKIIYSTNY